MKELAPSILASDFSKLGEEVRVIEEAGADLIHIDVMDGHYVPNISYGPAVMKSLLGKTKLHFDVHLMIMDADKYIKEFVTENTRYITVHQEACTHIHRTLQLIKSQGVLAGVSINPGTSLSSLEEVLPYVDLVLIMSVNPGFGGQKYIETTTQKISRLNEIRKTKGYEFKIEVDGGIDLGNFKEVLNAGADIIVAGSSVFKADDVKERVQEFKRGM